MSGEFFALLYTLFFLAAFFFHSISYIFRFFFCRNDAFSLLHEAWHPVNQKMCASTKYKMKILFIFLMSSDVIVQTMSVSGVRCTVCAHSLMESQKVDTKVKRSRKKLKNTFWIIYFVIISKRMKEISVDASLAPFFFVDAIFIGNAWNLMEKVAARWCWLK